MTSSKRVKSPRLIGQRNTTSTERFIIITNTKETEKNYFNGLKDYNRKNKFNIEVKYEKNNTQLVVKALEEKNLSAPLNPNVWIVFDYDQDEHFDGIIQEAEKRGISVAWSNPCFEVWLWAYLGRIPTRIGDSQTCIKEFGEVFYKKTEQNYDKNDDKIYYRLKRRGDEDEAFKRAEEMRKTFSEETLLSKILPSKMYPSTEVDRLVRMILKK